MKKRLTAFFMAWGMFCVIPCPLRPWDEGEYPRMLLCLPFVGLLVGVLWLLLAWLLQLAAAPALLQAVLLALFPSLLTGFLHLDGWMDCADAILSRRDLETRRRILKDSHVGSFAVIALLMLFLLQIALLAEAPLAGRLLCLLFIPAAARAAVTPAVFSLRPMPGSGYCAMFAAGVAPRFRAAALVLLLLFLLLPFLFCGLPGLCGAAAVLGAWLMVLWGRKNLGGMSGDIAGAAITFGELCGVAALALL